MKIRPEIIRVKADNLLLDDKNPRLPENVSISTQEEIWEFMKKAYDLDELALSMIANGYFEAKPMVVIPKDCEFAEGQEDAYNTYKNNLESQYIVVEGNRRLSTIQGLLKNKFSECLLTNDLKKQFKDLPVLFYPNRKNVLTFLGVHHLAVVRRWRMYERASFIVKLKHEKKMSIEDIQKTIGDKRNSVKKIYVCYKLVEIIKNYDADFNTNDAKSNFSFLPLATGQEPIRKFIGLESWNNIADLEQPILDDKKKDLKFLFECLFDNNSKKRLIRESRDITNKLNKIFEDESATQIFKDTLDINVAFDMVGGELIGLNNLSNQAKKRLETVNAKLSGMNIKNQVSSHEEGQKLQNHIITIKNIVEDINKKFENE